MHKFGWTVILEKDVTYQFKESSFYKKNELGWSHTKLDFISTSSSLAFFKDMLSILFVYEEEYNKIKLSVKSK